MAETWPASLPKDPRREGSRPPRAERNVLESERDSGPKKTRRLFTAVPSVVELSWRWSTSDYNDKWRPFLHGTLADGALSFDWTEPLSGDEYVATIIGGAAGVEATMGPGDNIIVSCRLRVI